MNKKSFIIAESAGPLGQVYLAHLSIESEQPGVTSCGAAFTNCDICAVSFKSEEAANNIANFLNLKEKDGKKVHNCKVVEYAPAPENLAKHNPVTKVHLN